MPPFDYRPIGEPLIKEIRDKVLARDSVVLIGPRYGGKKFLMQRLHEELSRAGAISLVYLKLEQPVAVSTAGGLRELIAAEVGDAAAGAREFDLTAGVLSPLERLISEREGPVILLAQNIDSISQHVARKLLKEVRSLVAARRLVVVLSGENSFHGLVHGPNSEFNCSNQYFLQGFDRAQFDREVTRYCRAWHLAFADEAAAHACLWERSGGLVVLMRLLLRDLLDARATNGVGPDTPVAAAELPNWFRPDLLRQPQHVINNAPECWEMLKLLLRDDVQYVNSVSFEPTPLELAGVVFRRGQALRVISPPIKEFLRSYYDDRRFGDLYARYGKWEQAIAHYERLTAEERVRPSTFDDRREVDLTIRAFGAALHTIAPKGPQEVGKLFQKVCRYVLGFSEISYWQRGEKWERQEVGGTFVSPEIAAAIDEILPTGALVYGVQAPAEQWRQYVLAAVVPGLRAGQYRAVVIGDYAADRVISREREHFAREFLDDFVEAYQHAVSIEMARERLKARDQHVEILRLIFEALGGNVRNAKQVLATAAREMRKLGYSRVSFCLVDPEKKHIVGVHQEAESSAADLAASTNWPLADPKADIQPWVMRTRIPKIVPDALREPLANHELSRVAGMKAFAVVPLLNRAEDAVGTVHIERADGSVPTEEEVNDLMLFGRQLAIAIEQSERVNLLQSALDKLLASLAIVDSTGTLRYANNLAGEMFGIESGWVDPHYTKPLSEAELGQDVMKMLRESLATGERLNRPAKRVGQQQDYRGDALTDVIRDWQGRPVGAVVRVQELSRLYQLFQAFRPVAEAKDTASASNSLLAAAQALGYEWGRLYLIDERDPERLISRASFGFKDQALAEKFNRGEVALPRRNESRQESWLSIEQGKPRIFCYTDERGNLSHFLTPHELDVIAVNRPKSLHQLEKRPGEYWADIPLFAEDKPFGKLSLNWDEDKWPYELETLEILAETASGLLAAFVRRDREFAEKERWLRQAAEKAMGETAHNIATRLAALPLLYDYYEEFATQLEPLQEINKRYLAVVGNTMEIIKRTRERLGAVRVKYASFDLADEIREALNSAGVNYIFDRQRLAVEADAHHLKMALLELIDNSRKAAPNGDPCVSVALETVRRQGGEWVSLIFSDNGPGVERELKARIFEDFYSRWLGRETGLGIGLSYVRQVVEAHCGTIRENGIPGRGATFEIELPRVAPASQE